MSGADNLDEYECGHCGTVHEVRVVDFGEIVRHLCAQCIREVLAWI